jgi:hypothetical protein
MAHGVALAVLGVVLAQAAEAHRHLHGVNQGVGLALGKSKPDNPDFAFGRRAPPRRRRRRASSTTARLRAFCKAARPPRVPRIIPQNHAPEQARAVPRLAGFPNPPTPRDKIRAALAGRYPGAAGDAQRLAAAASDAKMSPEAFARAVDSDPDFGYDHRRGRGLYVCEGAAVDAAAPAPSGAAPAPAGATTASGTTAGSAAPGGADPVDTSLAFKLHSRPGAPRTILLDFTGHTTTGSAWNSGGPAQIVTPPYDTGARGAAARLLGGPGRARAAGGGHARGRRRTGRPPPGLPGNGRCAPAAVPQPLGHPPLRALRLTRAPTPPEDGNPSSFSAGELQNIITIWRAVAEDYAAFDVRWGGGAGGGG